ncbi:MAG: hypothetical protein JWP11_1281 [Frankiales bacterium]|nr:hypothetical protein [Frankiales bacterium]
MSVKAPSLWHLPIVYAGFVLSFAATDSAKEATRSRVQMAEYLYGRAEDHRLLIAHGGLTFAAFEKNPAGGWYLAWISAWPHHRKHGSYLLTEICRRSDARRVALTLHCPAKLVRWYRGYGFLPAQSTRAPRDVAAAKEGLVKLHRPAKRRRA